MFITEREDVRPHALRECSREQFPVRGQRGDAKLGARGKARAGWRVGEKS
jgi:hypothetical protein